jgi:hypothetical protein
MTEQSQENKSPDGPNAVIAVAGKKRIRFFASFEEQEDELVTYWASITPLQRLRHLHEMIIHSFGITDEKLKNPNLGHSLKISSYEA